MASYLTQFHYIATQIPNEFNFEQESFDINHLYKFYSLKHERTPVSLFTDKMFAPQLKAFALDSKDYENLYVKTKQLARLASAQNQ
jgi:hypothetical protein